MNKIMAVAVFSFLSFSCVTANKPVPPTADKQPKFSEWAPLPSSDGKFVVHNKRTGATIVAQLLKTDKTVSEFAGGMIVNMLAKEHDIDEPEVSADQNTVVFRWKKLVENIPATGLVTVKKTEIDNIILVIFGVWPVNFDKEMTKDYHGISEIINVISVPPSKNNRQGL